MVRPFPTAAGLERPPAPRGSAWTRTLLASAAAGLVASCAVGPDFQRPAAPTGTYTARPLASATAAFSGAGGGEERFVGGGDIQSDWWTLFHSPALNRLIARALKANSDLAAAQAALRAAHQTYLAQRAVLFPTADLAASSTRNKSSEYLSPVPSSNQFYYSLQTAQVNVDYTLDVFGGLRRQTEQAKAQEDLQRFQTEAAYLTLTANVVAAAIQDASLRAQVASQERVIGLETEILAIMRRQLAAGQIAPTDLMAQQTALAQAQAALLPLHRQLDQEEDMLAYLTGATPDELPEVGVELAALQLPADLPVSLPSQLVEQRPDIRQAEANLHQASAAVGVAIAARLPAITLTGSVGGASGQWRNLLSNGNLAWTYGAGLAQPLFEGGALYHRQKAAEAALEQAKQQYRSAVLAAFQNVADTLKALKTDAAALDTAALAQSSAAQTLEISKRQLAAGQIAPIDALNAEQAEQQAEQALVQAEAARFSDTAALFQALGGGWWNRRADHG